MNAARRRQGEGTIYQLPDGRWRGAVELGWQSGRRQRRYVTRKTRAEARAAIHELSTAVASGRAAPGRVPTVAQWLDTYAREILPTTVRPSTRRRYEQEIRLYIAPQLGRHKLDKLRPHHLSAFYRDQLLTLSPGSVRRLHALIRRCLTIAVRWGLIPVNPALMVDPPTIVDRETTALTTAEARRLLEHTAGTPLHARWLLGLMLGMRQGEVLGLTWDDVDLDNGVLRIRHALQTDPGRGLTLVPPKTSRSRRTVPLPPTVVRALAAHRAQARRSGDPAPERWRDVPLVFHTRTGTPIHPRNDYRTFRTLLETTGLRRIRLHDLRHTCASLLLAEGVPARVVMEILGHSAIGVTMNTYSHVSPELARDAMERLDDRLRTGPDHA